MNSFETLITSNTLIKGLSHMSITTPTEVQSDTIMAAKEKKDLIVEAITGSGKTLAYLLPFFDSIDAASKELSHLIIAPTHELVVQINNVIKELAQCSGIPIRSTTIIGDVNINRQIDALKLKPHVIVGTAGRMLELIQLKKIKAHQVKTIVLDEADKLMSDKNIEQVKAVIKTTLRDRQILAYSASISTASKDRLASLMVNPEMFVMQTTTLSPNISHFCIITYARDKINTLRKAIHATKPKKAIVFINKNEMVQEIVSKLNYHQIKAVGVFGNATKADRKAAIDAFKSGKSSILVASDLVARGLDFQDVSHVFLMDLPAELEEYGHRAGRTGRMNQSGTAISIITEQDIKALLTLEKTFHIAFEIKALYEKELVDVEELPR